MGENPLEGELKLFVDGKPIGTIVSDAHFDFGAGDDHSAVSVWNGNKIECTFEVKDVDSDLRRMIENMRRRERLIRKALLYAVTHGYEVEIVGKSEKGEEVVLQTFTPKPLRWLFQHCPFVPMFRVFDKDGFGCIIKKGKIC